MEQEEIAHGRDVIVTGSRTASASINDLNVDPVRLPQNVQLLDDQLVDRAGFTDLSQLFDVAGGLSRQNSFGGAWDAYAIRGFSGDINQGPDLLVNRFVANRGFNARRDVATIESFQVLKGPASALSGKGEPGGSINIVTKAPLDRRRRALLRQPRSIPRRRRHRRPGRRRSRGACRRRLSRRRLLPRLQFQ